MEAPQLLLLFTHQKNAFAKSFQADRSPREARRRVRQIDRGHIYLFGTPFEFIKYICLFFAPCHFRENAPLHQQRRKLKLDRVCTNAIHPSPLSTNEPPFKLKNAPMQD